MNSSDKGAASVDVTNLSTWTDEEKVGRVLFYSGIALTLVVVLWPPLMFLSQPTGTAEEQLTALADDSALYKLNFFVASLIAPVLVVVLMLLALLAPAERDTPFLEVVGVFLLAPYVVLVSIAYTSQYTILHYFLAEGQVDEARVWLFENTHSVPYFLNQLGYTFFGLAALLIGYKYLWGRGLSRAIGVLLWVSGLLSLVAFFGLALENEMLNLATFVSGVLIVPVGILVAEWGRRLSRIT